MQTIAHKRALWHFVIWQYAPFIVEFDQWFMSQQLIYLHCPTPLSEPEHIHDRPRLLKLNK
ncbi:MAG: hypothetical protein CFE49_12390 [Pseudomonas sp. PGPPP3]|nr:MAG: hypothetical protein CFE49_12390 [Pseudomonas sp. PGPPP3]